MLLVMRVILQESITERGYSVVCVHHSNGRDIRLHHDSIRTDHVTVMGFGHEEHSSHQVSGGDTLRAFTFPVTAFTLHLLISVPTIYCQGDVIW